MIETIVAITMGIFIGKAIIQLGKIFASVFEALELKPPGKRETRKERKAREEREAREAEAKRDAEYEARERKYLYDRVCEATWRHNGKPMDIRNVPRLSFEQWLTFYNSAPEHWHFGWTEWRDKYCIFPNYEKGKLDINIFWATPEDLDKFIKWQENNYKNGDAAIFEERRAKEMSKLTKALREDMKLRHEQAQKEIAALEQQIAASMPVVKEEDPIQKCLREQREEKAKECHSLSEFVKYLIEKYPDYSYAETQSMMMSDGKRAAEFCLVHRHKPGNILKITGVYNEKTQAWEEYSSMR